MPKIISHQRYLAAVARLARVVNLHVVSLVENDLWKFHSDLHLGDIEDSVSDHLCARCRECEREERENLDRLPHPEGEFLAACVLAVRRLNPSVRTAASLYGLRQSPLFTLATQMLRKHFRAGEEDRPSTDDGILPEELTAMQISHVLDVLWPHLRALVPDEIAPVSRRAT